MSKKSGIKKLISAAMLASSISAAGGQLPVSAADSRTVSAGVTTKITDNWVVVENAKELKTEYEADAFIAGDADEIWKASCNKAVEEAGVAADEYSADAGLSAARGTFIGVLKNNCYVKDMKKKYMLVKRWTVMKNETDITNIQSAITPIIKSYIEIDMFFKQHKRELGNGLNLPTESAFSFLAVKLNSVEEELRKLPAPAEKVIRALIFDKVFGNPQKGITGVGSSLRVDAGSTENLKKAKANLNQMELIWKQRNKELDNSTVTHAEDQT